MGPSAQQEKPPVPNFFLIGPPRSGTTAIAENLGRHPEVFISDPKEPDYFFYQAGNPYNRPTRGRDSYEWYRSLFSNCENKIAVGDASTFYFFGHHVAKEIYKFNPQAKIISVLRNPVYRALSMYRFGYINRARRPSIQEFVDWFVNELSGPNEIGWLKDVGFYAKHLTRYLEIFPGRQVKVIFYEDLVKRPREVYADIFAFLEVAKAPVPLSDEYVNRAPQPRSLWLQSILLAANRKTLPFMDWPSISAPAGLLKRAINALNQSFTDKLSPQLTPAIYSELIKVYFDDMEKLEGITGRKLAGWRDGSMA